MDKSIKKSTLLELYKIARFIELGGVERFAKQPMRFDESSLVANRMKNELYKNVKSYVGIRSAHDVEDKAIADLFRAALDNLAKVLGVSVSKAEVKLLVRDIDLKSLSSMWTLDLTSRWCELNNDIDDHAFKYSADGFVIGEILNAIVWYVQAVNTLSFEQHELVEKMLEFYFVKQKGLVLKGYVADVLVQFPYWVSQGYHLKGDFKYYAFCQNYPSMGFVTQETNAASCFQNTILPLKGDIDFKKVA